MNAYPRIDPSQAHATCLRRLLLAVAIGTLALALTLVTAPARATQLCPANSDRATPNADAIDIGFDAT